MKFDPLNQLKVATVASVATLTVALAIPAQAATLQFSFTTLSGGSGSFTFSGYAREDIPNIDPVQASIYRWGSITDFYYTPSETSKITRIFENESATAQHSYSWSSFDWLQVWGPNRSNTKWWLGFQNGLPTANGFEGTSGGFGTHGYTEAEGYFLENDEFKSWTATQVPEPLTIAGSLIGLGSLAVGRRKYKKETFRPS